MLLTSLYVAIGGFWGAILRYLISRRLAGGRLPPFPYGTLFVNLSGSFFLGLLLGAEPPPGLIALLGTGFMGAYTTFSTLKQECYGMLITGAYIRLMLYAAATYLIGLALADAGFRLGARLF